MADHLRPDAVFAVNRLKIEILTTDKDLKYQLFGTHYRWREFGDSFKTPHAKASIVIDEDYAGRRIGFQESVRMYQAGSLKKGLICPARQQGPVQQL